MSFDGGREFGPCDRVSRSCPLVSCIMPTRNRRLYVPRAIAAFLSQDYAARELVIVDDGEDAIADLVPRDPRIRYLRLAKTASIGAKRNQACGLARGTVIVHWDDDDWHAHWRLSYQVGELLRRGAKVCGADRLWFYDEQSHEAFQYVFTGQSGTWLAGGTFCYRRDLWECNSFADVCNGEDTRFIRAVSRSVLAVLARSDFYVASIHPGNTSRRETRGPSFRRTAPEAVRRLIADIALPVDR